MNSGGLVCVSQSRLELLDLPLQVGNNGPIQDTEQSARCLVEHGKQGNRVTFFVCNLFPMNALNPALEHAASAQGGRP